MKKIFVYGSLMRGFRIHHWLKTAKFLGKGYMMIHYQMFSLIHFPGLVESLNCNTIWGEIYEVDDGTFSYIALQEKISGYETRTGKATNVNFSVGDTEVTFWVLGGKKTKLVEGLGFKLVEGNDWRNT